MILLTTSRKPSKRTRRFVRELSMALPLSLRVNRGKASVEDLVDLARDHGLLRVAIVGETKGNPSIIRFIRVGSEWDWLGQIYIRDVSLFLDRGERPPRIEADGLSVDGDQYNTFLKEVFDVYEETEGVDLVERKGNVRFLLEGEEVGPRFKIIGLDSVPAVLRRGRSSE